MSTTPPSTSESPASANKSRWLLFGCAGLLALLLVIVASVALTLWWMQRPIKPVVLSPREKAVIEEKLRVMENATQPGSPPPQTHAPQDEGENPAAARGVRGHSTQDRPYVPGSKELRITQREINGLLNANTDFGNTVRLEFAKDAINAYLAVPIPEDFPVGGGKMFRARGRFRISLGNGGAPLAVLEDLTVFGLSLPKDWLAGIKGENLLGDALGEHNGTPILRGVKRLSIEPGTLVLEVED